ncbi:MAG: head-tail connector protein [Caulobacteraceae bacterium]
MALQLVSAPAEGLISLDDAKAQLNVEFADDDTLIGALILAATDQVQANVQRRYVPQSLRWILQGWGAEMVLPVAPGGDSQGIQVDSIQYIDETWTQQTLDPSIYWARPHGDTLKIVLRWYQIWPWLGDGPDRVVVNFSINNQSAPSPAAIHACKLLVSHFYNNRDAVVGVDNRDSSTPLPYGVEALLSPERWY